MTKLKRDRKGQDDENILTFTNFKFIGFQTGVSQTFVKLKAMQAKLNILTNYKNVYWLAMRIRIRIEKHSKFPQALSGGRVSGDNSDLPS